MNAEGLALCSCLQEESRVGASYTPWENKTLHLLKFWDVFGRRWEGFGGIVGRCLGNMLGHVWEVVEGIWRGCLHSLGKLFRGQKNRYETHNNLCKPTNTYNTRLFFLGLYFFEGSQGPQGLGTVPQACRRKSIEFINIWAASHPGRPPKGFIGNCLFDKKT